MPIALGPIAALVCRHFVNGAISSPMTQSSALPSEPPRQALRARLAVPLVLAGLAVLLGALGPFGSYLGIGLPARVVHFSANMLAISLLVGLSQRLAARFLFHGAVPLWGVLAIALVLALPGALIVRWHLGLFAPQVLPHVALPELCLQTGLINVVASLAIYRIRLWLAERQPAEAPVPPAAAPDAVREKLPLHLRHARILALGAEDHYVRVHTERGEALVLIGLTQAMAALGEEAGIQVHRSHWVARDALTSGRVRLGRTSLSLEGGPTLPVSRTGRRRLDAEGLG